MVIVIGAGPAGLATAYYLKRLGVPFVILEQDDVGASWTRHYEHLKLHSLKQLSHLPGLAMPAHYPQFPSGRQFHNYLTQYARRFNFPIETGTRVIRASYNGSWQLITSQGERQCQTLIVASGIYATPYRPELPSEHAFRSTIMHARYYTSPEQLSGQRVLVVGVGNSGTEIAAALANHPEIAAVGVAVRGGAAFVPCPRYAALGRLAARLFRTLPQPVADPLLHQIQRGFPELGLPLPPTPPSHRTPVVGFALIDAIQAGQVSVHPAITDLNGQTVTFENGERAGYDTIILATGYRPTLDFFDPPPQLTCAGELEHPHPTLHVIGFHYPTTEPFLHAIGRAAKRVAYKVKKSATCTHNTF
jgi:lysine/ornithine N-monooxygenase